jgi:hypothetical protein
MSKIRDLQARKAAQIKAARDFNDATDAKATAENRDWSAEETAQYDQLRAAIEATNAAIVREQALAAEEAGLGAPMVTPPATGPPADAAAAALAARRAAAAVVGRITVEDNAEKDPKRGFKSFGEFARAVRRLDVAEDRRRHRPAPGAAGRRSLHLRGEGSGGDGGCWCPRASAPTSSPCRWRGRAPAHDRQHADRRQLDAHPEGRDHAVGHQRRARLLAGRGRAAPPPSRCSVRWTCAEEANGPVPVSDELLATAALTAYLPGKVAIQHPLEDQRGDPVRHRRGSRSARSVAAQR